MKRKLPFKRYDDINSLLEEIDKETLNPYDLKKRKYKGDEE